MEQLGPFHFFFTLSAAEKKWPEVATSILHSQGNIEKIIYQKGWQHDEELILVDPEDYLRKLCINIDDYTEALRWQEIKKKSDDSKKVLEKVKKGLNGLILTKIPMSLSSVYVYFG